MIKYPIKVFVSQPPPAEGKNPYAELIKKYNLEIYYKQLIRVEGITPREFRKEKVNILDYSAIIVTSRTAFEHFIKICEETRLELPLEMKYFCVKEIIALYLQKFINYRKRKVFFPKDGEISLEQLLLKYKNEKYLLPGSDDPQNQLVDFLRDSKLNYKEVMIYRTLHNDISKEDLSKFDIMVLFSPFGVKAIFENFPNYQQGSTKIISFGPNTTQTAKEHGLNINIEAPTPQVPSLNAALNICLQGLTNN
jgi:uroporphyrinogen-III synthase